MQHTQNLRQKSSRRRVNFTRKDQYLYSWAHSRILVESQPQRPAVSADIIAHWWVDGLKTVRPLFVFLDFHISSVETGRTFFAENILVRTWHVLSRFLANFLRFHVEFRLSSVDKVTVRTTNCVFQYLSQYRQVIPCYILRDRAQISHMWFRENSNFSRVVWISIQDSSLWLLSSSSALTRDLAYNSWYSGIIVV